MKSGLVRSRLSRRFAMGLMTLAPLRTKPLSVLELRVRIRARASAVPLTRVHTPLRVVHSPF